MATRRMPTTPGEILREEFLRPLHMTQRELARHIGCDVKVVNRIVNGRTSVTAEMALKLGAAFGTTPDFWLNAQRAVDLPSRGLPAAHSSEIASPSELSRPPYWRGEPEAPMVSGSGAPLCST